jgi:hypothetical protein
MKSFTYKDWDVKLVAFLYDLMRDDLPLGRVEEIVRNCEKTLRGEPLSEVTFTNGNLAAYAAELAERLLQDDSDGSHDCGHGCAWTAVSATPLSQAEAVFVAAPECPEHGTGKGRPFPTNSTKAVSILR